MVGQDRSKARARDTARRDDKRTSRAGDYQIALDRIMCEIETLRGTAHPRLVLADERMAS